MSLQSAVKSYGSKTRELAKKNKWSYYSTSIGNTMMKVGMELGKFSKDTAANKLSHDQFEEGAKILNIDADQLIGTTVHAPNEKTSRWGNFKEGLRERLTSASSMTTAEDMKPDKWYNPFSWGNQANPEDSGTFIGGDREYTAREIQQVGLIHGDVTKLALFKEKLGEDYDPLQLYGKKRKSMLDKVVPGEPLPLPLPDSVDVSVPDEEAELLGDVAIDPLKADGNYGNLSDTQKLMFSKAAKTYGKEGPTGPGGDMRMLGLIFTDIGIYAPEGDAFKNAYSLMYDEWSKLNKLTNQFKRDA